jgi:site-specific recombinase XerD
MILKTLYAFWVEKNYVMGNPWTGVSVPPAAQPRRNGERSLTMAQWRFVGEQTQQLPDRSSSVRLRFALVLLYASGLRLSEAVSARVDHLEWIEYPSHQDDTEHVQGWLLNVVGKGGKVRQVPLPPDVVAELARYLASRGLDADPKAAANEGAFLLGHASDLGDLAPQLLSGGGVDAKAGIATNTLYDQLKRFFGDCAQVLRTRGDDDDAQCLGRASTHWLRHTHASHSIAKGTRVEIEQEILGHASLATTSDYVTTGSKRRMQAIASFWQR